MRPTYRLEDVFGTRGRVAVLRCLTGVQVPLTVRQVAAQSGLSHPSASDALRALVGMGLVDVAIAGRSRVHWLVRSNLFVCDVLLPALEAEQRLPDRLIDELRARVPDGVRAAVLFGNYARGDQGSDSDVDVLVVADVASQLEQTLESFDRDSGELLRRLGAPVSVLGYTREQAVDLLRRGGTFMDEVASEGVMVCGESPAEWRGGGNEDGTR